MKSPIKILFVCLGNICRSPMAEAVLRHKVRERGLEGRIKVDSAGTGEWHVGQNSDPRTTAELAKNGIAPASKARQLKSSDFEEFDYILVMDLANQRDVLNWKGAKAEKVSTLLSWDPDSKFLEVPDPYYGGPERFAEIFRMIDRATDAVLEKSLEIGK